MNNPYIKNCDLWKGVATKEKLEKRIMEGYYNMDWRGGCDDPHCDGRRAITFQINESEDHYCLTCLYGEVYIELFGKTMTSNSIING